MHNDKTLIVALERTRTDNELIGYAAMAAKWRGVGKIGFVHVLPDSTSVGDREKILTELKAEVAPHLAGMPTSRVSYDVLSGPLMDQLLVFVAQKKADILLVGHRRITSGRRALARRLAMKAPCSVWMAPEGVSAELRRILVPIDFSEHSADALRMAVAMAKSGGARCLPLHVHFNEAVVTYEGYDQILRGEEQSEYRRFIASVDCSGIEVAPIFEEAANVSHAIGHVAQRVKADLIVMATRGRSRSSSILLGSVTEDTIIETHVPLLAVKHFGARLGVLEALLDKRFLKQGELHTD